MSKMAFCAFLSCPDYINTPFEVLSKTLARILFIRQPMSFNKSLKLSEKFLDRVEIWGVGWQVHQSDPGRRTNLPNTFCTMERGIIHDKNRFQLRPFPTVVEKLAYKILKHSSICRSLEDSRKDDAVLGICGKYLVPLPTMKLRNLDGCHSQWGPPGSSETRSFITARIIHIHQVIGSE